jgi:hypothetical protein
MEKFILHVVWASLYRNYIRSSFLNPTSYVIGFLFLNPITYEVRFFFFFYNFEF